MIGIVGDPNAKDGLKVEVPVDEAIQSSPASMLKNALFTKSGIGGGV